MSHILVIEDDKTTRILTEGMLKKNGFTVTCASDGQEGLDTAQKEPPSAILLDRIMPGMDGNEVLTRLKNDPQTRKIPVIMLTGSSAIKDVTSSLELGADDYIVKPFDEENLIVRLKKTINKA